MKVTFGNRDVRGEVRVGGLSNLVRVTDPMRHNVPYIAAVCVGKYFNSGYVYWTTPANGYSSAFVIASTSPFVANEMAAALYTDGVIALDLLKPTPK